MQRAGAARARGITALAATSIALAAFGCSAPSEPMGSVSGAATGFANDRAAYDYFLAKGLASFQAAGIVGNLDQESGVDPAAVQSGGPGRGIAQWSVGGRWDTGAGDNLVAFAAQRGEPTTSLSVQLDFIWYELETFSGYGLATLRATTDVTAATIAFQTDFEGCGACDQSQRVAYAKDVLAAYGGDVVDAGSPDGGSAADARAIDGAPEDAADDAIGSRPLDAASDAADRASAAPLVTDVASGCATAPRPSTGAPLAWLLVASAAIASRARRSRLRARHL